MKNLVKISMLLLLLLLALTVKPNFIYAATTVGTEDQLTEAISSAQNGDVIELSADISLTSPVEVTGKELIIDGKGFTITKDASSWAPNGNNGTLLTAGGEGTKLTLRNLKLTNSQKYGAQSYNGAHLVLDNVTVSNCDYGGIMVNAGTVEVINLTLNRNGNPNNNGIEIGKGSSLQTGENMPKLLMNGTLTSTEKENVVYIAENDELTEFEVENADTTVDKVFVDNNQVVITDSNNNVKYVSNTTETDIIGEDEYVPNVTISLHLMDKIVPVTVISGTVISQEEAQAAINLQELGLSNYTIAGFYSDSNYSQVFDFSKAISADTSIYVKLNSIPAPTEPKDDTPKTGTTNYLGIAVLTVIISLTGIAVLQKKEY